MLRKISWTLLVSIFLFSTVFASLPKNLAEHEQAVWKRYEASSINEIPMSIAKSDKALQGMYTIIDEDFEGEFPGDLWTTWGGTEKDFCWGKVTDPVYMGKSALWCGVETSLNPYDKNWDETVFHPVCPVKIPVDLIAKWIKLEFYLKLVMPEINEDSGYLEGNLILSLIVQKKDGGKEYFSKIYDKNTDGYELQEVDIEEFIDASKVARLWFEMAYRTENKQVPVGIGAWIDNLKMRIHYWNQIEANFEAMPLAGKAPLEVTFFSDFEGATNNFLWNFGDGNTLKYSESYDAKTPKNHTYTEPGEYDVTLIGWNPAYEDTLVIPNLIYVDPELDYCPLTLEVSGATYPGEDWSNAIDHDIYGHSCMASGVKNDAWAKFVMADDQEKLVSKIRLLNDVAGERAYRTNCALDVEISLSLTGAFSGEETVFAHTCTGLKGEWDEVSTLVADEPVLAKYVKVEILSARGADASYRELVEMQVFGAVPESSDEFATQRPANQNAAPTDFALMRNYPNPFNPETTIRFQLKETSRVILSVYNLNGQLVRTLTNGELSSGAHNIRWNARDTQGNPVAGGIYLYKLQIENETAPMQLVRKMMLLK